MLIIMKKFFASFSVALFLTIAANAQSKVANKPANNSAPENVKVDSTVQQKRFSVSGAIPDWQLILAVVDQSTANHQTVELVKQFITVQLNAQVADSTKKTPPKK